jgi:hypothetical protein
MLEFLLILIFPLLVSGLTRPGPPSSGGYD